jgi:hypothetical protein
MQKRYSAGKVEIHGVSYGRQITPRIVSCLVFIGPIYSVSFFSVGGRSCSDGQGSAPGSARSLHRYDGRRVPGDPPEVGLFRDPARSHNFQHDAELLARDRLLF